MKRAVVRLPREVVERLDLLVQKLRVAHPARSVSRAAVVRALIAGALDAAERDASAKPFPASPEPLPSPLPSSAAPREPAVLDDFADLGARSETNGNGSSGESNGEEGGS